MDLFVIDPLRVCYDILYPLMVGKKKEVQEVQRERKLNLVS